MTKYTPDDIMCNPAQISICVEFLSYAVPFFSRQGVSLPSMRCILNQGQFFFDRNIASEILFESKSIGGNILVCQGGGDQLNPNRLIARLIIDQFEIEKKRDQIVDWVKHESMWLNGNILIHQAKDLKSLQINFNGDRYNKPNVSRINPNNGYIKIYQGTMTGCYTASGEECCLNGSEGW